MLFFRKLEIIALLYLLLLGGCGDNVFHNRNDSVVQGNVLLQLYIVRHAEAYKNVIHLPGTSKEKLDSLTPKGLKQAASIGKHFKGKGVAAVITSPTGRTRQTAEAISRALGLEKPYLENRAFSSLKKGKTQDGKPVSWSWRKGQWKAGRDPRPEGGESLSDGTERAIGAINGLVQQYRGKGIAVVSHGDICAALLGEAQKTSMAKRYKVHEVATGSVSKIVITDSGWYLQSQGVVPDQN